MKGILTYLQYDRHKNDIVSHFEFFSKIPQMFFLTQSINTETDSYVTFEKKKIYIL